MSENKEIIKKEESNFLLTQENCHICKYAKEQLKEPIKKGDFEVLDVNTPEGFALAEKHKVQTVPIVINKNEKTGFEQVCHLNQDGSIMYCDDGTEKKVL